MKFYFSCLLFLLIQSAVFGGQYPFRFYTSADGLPNKSIFTICNDHRGYIWFGTNGGGLYYLNSNGINSRYDPEVFENATIRKLYFSKNNELFIGSEKGLFIDDGLILKEIKFDTLKEIKIIEIFQDSEQNIWIGTANSGLYQMQYNERYKEYNHPVRIKNLSSETFFSVCEDTLGRIWAGGFGGGIDIITVENNSPKITRPTFYLHKKEKLITSLKSIGNNTILIGTYGGGVLKVMYDNSSYDLNSFSDSSPLSNEIIWDIEKDESNRIWIATDKTGLFLADGNDLRIFNMINGLPSNQVIDLHVVKEHLWIGTIGNGIGMLLSEHIKFFKNELITQNNLITSIAKYDENSILIGTYGGGVYTISYTDSIEKYQSTLYLKLLKNKHVNTLFCTRDKNVYVGTANEGLYEIIGNKHNNYTREDGILLNSINTVYAGSDKRIWIGTIAGLSIITDLGVFNIDEHLEYGIPNNEIQCIAEDTYNRIWIGTLGGLSCIDGNNITNYNKSDGLLSDRINSLFSDKNNLWIGTAGAGLFYVDLSSDSVRIKQHFSISKKVTSILSCASVSDSILLIGTGRGLEVVLFDSSLGVLKHNLIDLSRGFSGGEMDQNQIVILDQRLVIVPTSKGLIRINLDEIIRKDERFGKVYIEKIELPLQQDWTIQPDNLINWQQAARKLKLKHNQNYISLQLASDIIVNEKQYRFEYRLLQNKNPDWLKCNEDGTITLNNLRFGKYQLQARIIDSTNNICSEILNYSFEITPPFYYTWWFLSVAIILIVMLSFIVIKIRERKLVERNLQLEKTIQKRTQEIVQQKDQISNQKEIIEQKNKDITDSINYASKIQEALLPSEKILAENFKDFFIIYKPRDIVSGDFYWVLEKNNETICVLADCTGHGVPGAFMSMLGMSLLNEIVDKNRITSPEQILNRLRAEIIRSLKQDDPSNPKDGMDLSVCVFNKSLSEVTFAGANNSVQIIRNGELTELKGDRMPVAFYYEMESFASQTHSLKKDDCIYMFTDGYTDQFGGIDGKKFMKKPLKRLLQEISANELSDQKIILENKLSEWMEGYEQVDDISVLGFKI